MPRGCAMQPTIDLVQTNHRRHELTPTPVGTYSRPAHQLQPASGEKSSRPTQESNPAPGATTSRPASIERARKSPVKDNEQLRFGSLPIELKKKILLDSLEPNLARASTSLGISSSTESMYKPFILFAFFENDERLPIEDSQAHFKPAAYRFLTLQERSCLQKAILDCQWCTFSRIKQSISILVRLALEQGWKYDRRKRKAGESHYQPPLPSLNNYEGLRAFIQGNHHHQSDVPCTLVQKRRGDVEFLQSALIFHYIPTRVLNPKSWDNETSEYLLFIRQRLSPKPAFDVSAVFQGLEKAIKERNVKALYQLLAVQYTAFRYSVRSDTITEDQLKLPVRLFHLAVQQGEEDTIWILELLIAARTQSIPKDDPILTKWAQQGASARRREKKELAIWILDHLRGDELDPRMPPCSYRHKIRQCWAGPTKCPFMIRLF
jgi:hypothetical protein